MSVWLISENYIYVSEESAIVNSGDKIQLTPQPALLLDKLIEAKNRKGSDVLSKDEIAMSLWPDPAMNTGWSDDEHLEKFKKNIAILRRHLPKESIERIGRGYRLKNDIREYPEFYDTAEGQRLYPSGDELVFKRIPMDNPQNNGIETLNVYFDKVWRMRNRSGDNLQIVYSGANGGWFLFHRENYIKLDRQTIYTLACGFRTGIIQSIKLNDKDLDFYSLISYGVSNYDLVAIIENSLYMMYTNRSYRTGHNTFCTLRDRLVEYVDTLDDTDEKKSYLNQWDTVGEWAENRLVNNHEPEALVILSWLLLHKSGAGLYHTKLYYPELVLLEALDLRKSLDDDFNHGERIKALDDMIDDFCEYLEEYYELFDEISAIRGMSDEQIHDYKFKYRSSLLINQPLKFGDKWNSETTQCYPTNDLSSLFENHNCVLKSREFEWISSFDPQYGYRIEIEQRKSAYDGVNPSHYYTQDPKLPNDE